MYQYKELRPKLFTEEGQEMFLKIRDRTKKLLEEAGAVQLGHAIIEAYGDSWLMIACLDRMVELGEIREIPQKGCMGQHRVFVKGRTNE